MSNDSIVLELQREALDEKVRSSALLRKALVVSKKLRIKDFEEWANKELSGYQVTDTTPEYRLLRGEIKAWNPYYGWVPVYFSNPQTAEAWSRRGCGQPIPALEVMLPSLEMSENELTMPFPKKYELELLKQIAPLTKPALHVQPAEVLGIIQAVRTIILKWTLKLEEDGILGQGLTFSPKEQEKAISSAASHITNFYGPVGQSQIQLQSPQALQVMAGEDVGVADTVYIEQAKDLVSKIKDALAQLGLNKPQADEVAAEIATVEAQMRSPNPKRSIMNTSFETIRRILEAGAGGAVGQLIVEIGKIIAG